ncbi:tyrosine-type recombinase/integrase [Mycobacteroides abscessus]|uniref:tyrosine-type recombinase/integrase n=1 Tax=Mycobacteroides abscessus TaxID=36809 RepID=UPI0009D47167|nr:tyrosine-type recombinase/integrase [Mycobacteroides abscessus]SLL18597.1 putative phage integrase [Mycobacteroides abscessus subsp. abscessus]
MPRQRLAPGEHGKVTCTRRNGKHYATTYLRLQTGRRVEREATGKSAEDARRNLTARIVAELAAGTGAGVVNGKTTLDDLFEAWVADKVAQGSLSPQSEMQYRRVWRGHGSEYLGALRITELTTSRADAHLKTIPARQSSLLRTILVGMFSMAVRFDVLHHNPIREAQAAPRGERKPARALTAVELEQVRRAVKTYATPSGRSGPRRGVMLPAFVELLAATGARPGEVLAIRWQDVDLLDDTPSVTVNGTVMDHDRVPGKTIHRQDSRKGGAPAITVLLPKFGVEALTALTGETVSMAPSATVLTNRDGGLVSLSNIRSALREALASHEDLRWITPHSFRRSVATVVRDGLGIEAAQQQLGHSEMATTEQHYAQRRTTGPDARAVLDKWAGQGKE